MSVAQLRQIVSTRHALGERIKADLTPLEQRAHEFAISSARFHVAVLEAHSEAALGPSVGMDVVMLLADASRAAAESLAKLGAAHGRMLEIGIKERLIVAGAPDCPPNEPGQGVTPFFWGA